LGRGFLTGKIDVNTTFKSNDIRGNIPRFAPEVHKANQALVDLLRRAGERHRATPAQIALAWLLARKPWVVSLFGTRKLERLEENLGAINVDLAAEDLSEIESVAGAIKVEGDRYPPEHMKLTGL
jgi:aryl-alcohol dehydrogenase-like predicted oxidoreductase